MNDSRMFPERRSAEDEQLDAMFRAYRSACEPGDVSVNFMPELWQRIEKVQSATFSFRRIAKAFVSVAAALTLILVGVESLRPNDDSPMYSATYVEALADHSDIDAPDLARPEISDLSEVI